MLNYWLGKEPSKITNKIVTPLLFFQGKNDELVDEKDSHLFFNNLHHNSNSHYTEWNDEGHSLTKDHNKADYYKQIEQKLKELAKGGEQFTDFSSEVNISDSKMKRYLFRFLAIVSMVLGLIENLATCNAYCTFYISFSFFL